MSHEEKLNNLVEALVSLDDRLDPHAVRMVGLSEGLEALQELCRAARAMKCLLKR